MTSQRIGENMTVDTMIPSETGDNITVSEDGKMVVPNKPILSISVGEGQNTELWSAVQVVFDAAVMRAYHGERQVIWHSSNPSEQAQTSGEENEEFSLGFNLEHATSTYSSVLFSGILLFKQMGWSATADLLMKAASAVLDSGLVPQDSEIMSSAKKSAFDVIFRRNDEPMVGCRV